MKLIFFYLSKCSGINFNLNVNFSEDKFISIHDDRKIHINNLPNTAIDKFYGNNILNVTAIVGKNGTGKSTILNLLGLKRLDVLKCYLDSEWVAIYEDEGDFYLEGMNVKGFLEKPPLNSKYIAYKMKLVDNEIKFGEFISFSDSIQNKIFIIHTPDFTNCGHSSMGVHENDNMNYGFKRNYLKTTASNYYTNIAGNKEFCSNLDNKFIIIKKSKANQDIDIGFYTNHKRYFKSRNKLHYIKSHNDIAVNTIENTSQLFIIDILEEYVTYIIENIFNKEELNIYYEIIANNLYDGDLLDFTKITNHFISLIVLIKGELDSRNDEILDFLNNPDWEHWLFYIQNNAKIKFRGHEGLSEEYSIMIPLDSYDENNFLFIEEILKFSGPLTITHPPMSSGELNFINKISGIDKAIKLSINSNENVKGFILLLDEYDENFHPEWSRVFFKKVLDFLAGRYSKYQFQIILSTHSPYIISDLLKDNVVKISFNEQNGHYSSCKAKSSFATNIYEIINDSFFLKQPLGEFAVDKINSLMKRISNITNDNSESDYLEICKVVDLIDDSFIKGNLREHLKSKFSSNKQAEIDELERQIKFLNNKKEFLKREV